MRLRLLICLLVVAAPATASAAPTAATAPTRVAHIGGATVGYRSIGSGRPLVLVMGLGGTMDAWPPSFVDALAAAHRRVILLDNDGVGRSSARSAPLTIRGMADTTAALMKKLGLRGADVAGWSMGGMIAQSLAVRHPARMRRLVLLATAPGDGSFAAPDPAASGALTGSDTLALLGLLFPPDSGAAIADYVKDISTRADLVPMAPPAALARQLAASGAWLTGKDGDGARVARLALPVLVGGGEADRLLPIANQRRLAELIPHARLITYADAAHGFFIQRAGAFVPRLLAFLKR